MIQVRKRAQLTADQRMNLSIIWTHLEKYLADNIFHTVEDFDRNCPKGFVPVDVDDELNFAFVENGPWRMCVYVNPLTNCVILKSDVLYHNPETDEWEEAGFLE